MTVADLRNALARKVARMLSVTDDGEPIPSAAEIAEHGIVKLDAPRMCVWCGGFRVYFVKLDPGQGCCAACWRTM